MRISEAMTTDVRVVRPDQTIAEAARLMGDIDAGIVPVAEGDRLIGMITDRDIAVRAVAEGRGPETRIGDIMTADVRYCYEDQDADDVAGNMGDQQIRRIPVVDRDKRLVGIVSIGDLAQHGRAQSAGLALAGITRPGGDHTQSGDARA